MDRPSAERVVGVEHRDAAVTPSGAAYAVETLEAGHERASGLKGRGMKTGIAVDPKNESQDD